MHFELSPLIIWIALWIVNTYSKFQVNIFSNKRNITKCQFSHPDEKQRQGYSNTSGFLRKWLKSKVYAELHYTVTPEVENNQN